MSEQNATAVATLDIEFVIGEQDTLVPDSIDSAGVAHFKYSVADGSSVRVGRAQTNDVVIVDSDVSRFHAAFAASVSGLVLSDLSSTNGTFVNGKPISSPVDLKSNDVVVIGKAKITVQLLLAQDSSVVSDASTQLAEFLPCEVTVLLVDVCGYTKMSQALPPDAVTDMLRDWFSMVAKILEPTQGEIDKYIGDCVMAIWRNPKEPAAVLAREAAQAALTIRTKTLELEEMGPWAYRQEYPWRCRAALHSGVALIGTVGGGKKRAYTALGDNINIAFRIESIAGKLKKDVIMSAYTAGLIGSSASLTSLGRHDLDGRSGEIELFSLEALPL